MRAPHRRLQPVRPGPATISDDKLAHRLTLCWLEREDVSAFWERHAPHLAPVHDEPPQPVPGANLPQREREDAWSRWKAHAVRERHHEREDWLLDQGLVTGPALDRLTKLRNLRPRGR